MLPQPRPSAAGLVTCLLIAAAACSDDATGPIPGDVEIPGEVEITDEITADLALYPGEVGAVFEVGDVFRKGYVATEIHVTFAGYADFDTVLEVDPVTALTILRLHNDDLTSAEQEAFGDGVAAVLVARDEGGTELARREMAALVLDASNVPVSLSTELSPIPQPVSLTADVPYLLQPESSDGVLNVSGVGLGAETSTDMASGTVGSEHSRRCPTGSVAISHHGAATLGGSYLGQIGLVCAVLEPDGSLGTVSSTATIGGVGSTTNADCGEGRTLIGGTGHHEPSSEGWIRNLSGRCYDVHDVWNGEINSASNTSTGSLGASTSGSDLPYDVFCPDGSLVTGLRAKVATPPATAITGVAYICRSVNQPGWGLQSYVPNDATQNVYLTAVDGAEEDNTYLMAIQVGGDWQYAADRDGDFGLTPDEEEATSFVLTPNADGWVAIRIAGKDDYLVREDDGFVFRTEESEGFRFITADIDWSVTDRGTRYHQPIVSQPRLDFAYQTTIKNCSPATLEEDVGTTDVRTQTITTSMSQNLSLFASAEASVSYTVGAEVEGGLPGVGAGKATTEQSMGLTISAGITRDVGQAVDSTQTRQSQVSRTRSLTVPPFTAVEAYDAVRSLDRVRLPYTQVFRLRGTYGDGTPLTGAEIATQAMFNFVGGTPTEIGTEHVDVGIDGHITIQNMFEAESNVDELPGMCG